MDVHVFLGLFQSHWHPCTSTAKTLRELIKTRTNPNVMPLSDLTTMENE